MYWSLLVIYAMFSFLQMLHLANAVCLQIDPLSWQSNWLTCVCFPNWFRVFSGTVWRRRRDMRKESSALFLLGIALCLALAILSFSDSFQKKEWNKKTAHLQIRFPPSVSAQIVRPPSLLSP
jgi:hypothetical protein